MNRVTLFLVLCSIAFSLYPVQVGSLPNILRPDNISVIDKELYIIQGSEVFTFSLPNLKLLRKFGKKGEGPGEVPVNPFYLNKVTAYPNYVMIEGINKIVFFTRLGVFKNEIIKTSTAYIRSIPFGDNFVVNKIKIDANSKTLYNSIFLFDSKFKEIKELFSQEHFQQPGGKGFRLNPILDLPTMDVYNNKLYVEDSSRGFIIEIFNLSGNKINIIRKPYEKMSISAEFRKRTLGFIQNDSIIKAQGGWDAIKDKLSVDFPSEFPPIQEMNISGNRIYIQTYKEKSNNIEYIIMDLSGNILKRVYLPRFDDVTVTGKLLGARLHVIYNGKLYNVSEDEENECWVLNILEIK